MRAMMFVVLWWAVVPACDGSQPTAKDAGEPVQEDVKDATAGSDVAPEGDACKDLRRPGDQLQTDDWCWDPPLHYCSAGWAGGPTVACAFEPRVCCDFPSGCTPCGWSSCLQGTPECPTLTDVTGLPECQVHKAYEFQLDTGEFCWDGLTPAP